MTCCMIPFYKVSKTGGTIDIVRTEERIIFGEKGWVVVRRQHKRPITC